FFIQSDASKVGAGAVLYQYDDKDRRVVVAYASWLFNSAQRNYTTTERELLALVKATRKWKPYLRGSTFLAETDHQPLERYLDIQDPYGKIARWAAELTQFNFKVKYIKGISNIPPDSLSRSFEEVPFLEYVLALNNNEVACSNNENMRPSKVLAKSFSGEYMEISEVCEHAHEEIFVNDFVRKLNDQDWVKEIKS